MGTTSVQQPQQTPATTPAVSTSTSGGTPNDAAARTAETERHRKSAGAVPKEWQAALGGLLPPDATGPNPTIAIKGGELPKFRRDTFKLVVNDVAGLKQAQDYLVDAHADAAYASALSEVALAASTDKAGFDQLRKSIATLCSPTGIGDINVAAMRILTTLALSTEDGKTYLKCDDGSRHEPIAAPLVAFADLKFPASATDDTSKATREGLLGLANAIKDPHSAAPGSVATVSPVPLTPAQQKAADALIGKILTEFPPDKGLPLALSRHA